MTLRDFLKRLNDYDMDKMIIYKDPEGGWTDVWFEKKEQEIILFPDWKSPFTSENE